jgi:diguanylate cyclase (GGDEF)-like protein
MSGVKKILVVDDEKMNIIALAHFLKPQYEIIVAVDGASALDAAEKHMPDIILLDIIMPDMSGFEVLIKLKDCEATKDIPVIFITGLNSAKDEEKGLSLGAVDYITKPFNKLIVKSKVRTHLRMYEYIRIIDKLCMMDALTGLPNRQGFETRMNAEWERAGKEKKPLGLVMLDIDKFKIYNDTYGHSQGDNLLQAIAGVFGKIPGRADFAARYGGEKFTCLLPGTGPDEAMSAAEQIWKDINEAVIQCAEGTDASATVSLAVISKIPAGGDSTADFFAEANKLLHTAKENGGNRICR